MRLIPQRIADSMTHALREVVIVFRVLVAEGHLHGSGGSMNHFEPQCEVVNIADQQFASGWPLCPLRLLGDGPGGRMSTGTIAAWTGSMPPRPARIGASHDSFSWNGLWLGVRGCVNSSGRRSSTG